MLDRGAQERQIATAHLWRGARRLARGRPNLGTGNAMGLMTLGFWRSSPTLRYLALGLFGLTVARMFAIDLRELDGAYRVAGFVTPGLVLLIASFLYQRRLPMPTAR